MLISRRGKSRSPSRCNARVDVAYRYSALGFRIRQYAPSVALNCNQRRDPGADTARTSLTGNKSTIVKLRPRSLPLNTGRPMPASPRIRQIRFLSAARFPTDRAGYALASEKRTMPRHNWPPIPFPPGYWLVHPRYL